MSQPTPMQEAAAYILQQIEYGNTGSIGYPFSQLVESLGGKPYLLPNMPPDVFATYLFCLLVKGIR